ncbi:hypothetical protein NRB56_76680 [Nocardia sp. RB56]|uniref:Uncharacterized protein n=1 Tax=Nocardia aurantia TaxID=2585199 RepID=A0A7K0E2D5_9NOCA|nr:hypothetical protein [Nocardia aurantia]
MTYAVWSGRNGATRSASVTGASEKPDTSKVSMSTRRTVTGSSSPSPLTVSTHTGSALSRM